jgi:hypothetical protein
MFIDSAPVANTMLATDKFWERFDLKQSPFCVGLDVNIKSPLVVIPDLNSAGVNLLEQKRFELDLGTVKVRTRLIEQPGRWTHFPLKTLRMMEVRMENTDLKFEFHDGTDKVYCPIFHEKQIDIDILIPNWSPFFVKPDDADYEGPLVVDR